MVLTDAEIAAASARGAARKAVNPTVASVRYDRRVGRVVIALSSGLELAFPPSAVQGLEHARPADLVDAQISPSGLGIHFPPGPDRLAPGLCRGGFPAAIMPSPHGRTAPDRDVPGRAWLSLRVLRASRGYRP